MGLSRFRIEYGGAVYELEAPADATEDELFEAVSAAAEAPAAPPAAPPPPPTPSFFERAAGVVRGALGGDRRPVDPAPPAPSTAAEMLNVGVDAGVASDGHRSVLDQPRPADMVPTRADLEFQSMSPAAQQRAIAARMPSPGLKTAPERGIVERALAPTVRKPMDQSLFGAAMETAGDAARGIASASANLGGRAAFGGVEALGDLLGAEGLANYGAAAARAANDFKAQIRNPQDPNGFVSQVFESTFTSLPLAALGGGALPAMGAASALQEYSDSRARGLTPLESLDRSAYMGVAEMLGERVSLPALQRLVSQTAGRMTSREFGETVAEYLVKEQVGEQTTLALQSAYEKLGVSGQRRDMTLSDYLTEMAETAKVTLGQSLLTGGIGAGMRKMQRSQPPPIADVSLDAPRATPMIDSANVAHAAPEVAALPTEAVTYTRDGTMLQADLRARATKLEADLQATRVENQPSVPMSPEEIAAAPVVQNPAVPTAQAGAPGQGGGVQPLPPASVGASNERIDTSSPASVLAALGFGPAPVSSGAAQPVPDAGAQRGAAAADVARLADRLRETKSALSSSQRPEHRALADEIPDDLSPARDEKLASQFDAISRATAELFGSQPLLAVESAYGFDGFDFEGRQVVNVSDLEKPAPFVAWHEVTHHLQNLAKGGNADAQRVWQPVFDAIYDLIPEADRRVYAERYLFRGRLKTVNAERGRVGKAPMTIDDLLGDQAAAEELKREMVADFGGKRAMDRGFIDGLARREPKAFGGFARRWIQALNSLIDKLRGQRGLGLSDVDLVIRDLQKAKALWADAMIAWQRRGGTGAQPTQRGIEPAGRGGETPGMRQSRRAGAQRMGQVRTAAEMAGGGVPQYAIDDAVQLLQQYEGPPEADVPPGVRRRLEGMLLPLMERAIEQSADYAASIKALAERLGAEAKTAPVKSMKRSVEKLYDDEAETGQPSQPDGIKDLVRASIVVRSEEEVADAIAAVRETLDVVRVKDRFAKPLDTGYRDVLMNVRLPDGLMAELQIHIPEMLAAKELGHLLYEIERALPPGEEKSRLVAAQGRLYGAAYDAATGVEPRLAPQAETSESNAARSTTSSSSIEASTTPVTADRGESPGLRNTGSSSLAKNSVPAGSDFRSTTSTSNQGTDPDQIVNRPSFSRGIPKSRARPGVNAEVAPNPSNPQADAWRRMSARDRERVTKVLGDRYVPRVLEMVGLKGDVEYVTGGFLGETNPAMLVRVSQPLIKERGFDVLRQAAKAVGRFLDQQATIAYDENVTDGEGLTYFVKLTPDRELTADEVDAIFNMVYSSLPQAAGFTARDGGLVFGNFSDLSPEEFRSGIEAAVERSSVRLELSDRTFRSDYIDEAEYAGDQQGQAEEGGLDVRWWSRDLDSLQARFREDLNRELGLVGQERPARDSTRLRAGQEDLSAYGVEPGKRTTVRKIAEALNARAQDVGAISPYDYSPQAVEAMAQSLATEAEYQLLNDVGADTGTGVGWYSVNWPAAIKKLARFYPELSTNQDARNLFTALIAITSNGEKVKRNLAMAMELYEGLVHDGKRLIDVGLKTKQQDSLDKNLRAYQDLIDRLGVRDATDYLLGELRVGDIKRALEERGEKFNSGYKVDQSLPRSAMMFGPKLGAFFANLMGREGYLTMDLWWSRTFNRLRGDLLPQPTVQGMARLKMLLGDPQMTDDEAVQSAIPHQEAYAKRNYKGGSELEKAANTVLKAALQEVNEAPQNASDREMMVASAQRARDILAARGYDMTMADLQAALWYYEKRLYKDLGAKDSDAIGYEEAINEVIAQGNRSVRPAARADRFAARVGPGSAGAEDAGDVPPAARLSASRRDRDGAGRGRDRGLASLPGAPDVVGASGPDPRLVEVAEAYARQTGLRFNRRLADDLEEQQRFLEERARELGYGSIDELFEKDYPAFERLAAEWRGRNPAEVLLSRGPRTSKWLDDAGRLRFLPTAALYDFLAPITRVVLAHLGMNYMPTKLKRQVRQMKQALARAQEVAVEVAKESFRLSEDDRALISDLVEGEVRAGITPPQHIVRMAAGIQRVMDQQTDELVRLGMLSQESADMWRGKYLPRFYRSKLRQALTDPWNAAVTAMRKPGLMMGIRGKSLKGRGLWETVPVDELQNWLDLGWQVRDNEYDPSASTEVQVWRDFTREEREKMGEIRDAGFRFIRGYLATQRDIALGRLFEGIAADREMSSKNERPGWVQVPDGTVPGTGVKRYGMLAGRWVPQEVLNHLKNHDDGGQEALRLYRKALAAWKEGKTVLNPVAHANNIMSNVTMAHFAGVSYWEPHKYAAAAMDLVRNRPMAQEARDAGLFLGTLSQEELLNQMPKELRAVAAIQESRVEAGASKLWDMLSLWMRKPAGRAYEAEDLFFRYVIYRDARGRGLSPEDAVDYSQRYVFTYDDLPKTMRVVRDFGLPFVSYTYKVIPALLHTAAYYPWRMAAPASLMFGLNTLMYALAVGDEGEEMEDAVIRYLEDPQRRAAADELRRREAELLPPWMRGYTSLMTPKTVRLGMDEVTGTPLFWDVSRVIPGGDIFDVTANSAGVPWPQPLMPSHPIWSTFSAMFVNKDMFFGKEIVDSNDTVGEAFEKRAGWIWRQFTPAIAYGNYHSERLANVVAQMTDGPVTWRPSMLGQPDATGIGRDGMPVQPRLAAMQTVGIKVRPISLELSEQIEGSSRRRMIRDIDNEIRSLRRLNQRGALSDRLLEVAEEGAQLKKDRLREGLTVDGDER